MNATATRIRALIVDDEPLARERIRSLLKESTDIEVVGEAPSGRQAIELLRTKTPELVFLDVMLGDTDGFAVLEAIGPSRPPVVVFVTAFDAYAIKAFDVRAIDYLLKPFDRVRFLEALARARSAVLAVRGGAPPRAKDDLLEALAEAPRFADRLVVKSGGKIEFVMTDEVDWFEAAGNYVKLHVGEVEHLLRGTLNDLEQRLDPARFVRIHRSTIVNVQRVRSMEPIMHGDARVLLEDGTELTLSRSHREQARKALGVK